MQLRALRLQTYRFKSAVSRVSSQHCCAPRARFSQRSPASVKPQPEATTFVSQGGVHSEFVRGNDQYSVKFGDKKSLALPPAKQLAIVSCMDSRIEVLSQLGLKEGDAHIIRNAGGSAKDALRSLIISQRLLGTREIALFHHTDCGMVRVQTKELRHQLKEADPSDSVLAHAVDSIEFLEFSDLDGSVTSDVKFLRDHPLILRETVITGWVYHVETGKIRRVA